MRLKPSEFSQVCREIRASDKVIRYVKRVLVDGESAADVGRDIGITRQAVTKQTRRFYEHWQRSAGALSNWQFVAVRLPQHVAEQVKRLEEQQLEMLQRS